MSNEQNIRILSDLREEALAIIKKYNELAEQEKYDTRIGVIDASVDLYQKKYDMAIETLEGGEEPSEELINSMEVDANEIVKNYDDHPYWSTEFPGVKEYGWKPSGLNCS